MAALLLVPVLQSLPSSLLPLLPEASAQGGITLNNAKSTTAMLSTSVTLSGFNVGSGSDRLLVVGIESDNQGATSVKFGTTALTRAVYHFSNDDTEFWYLKAPNGTANIVVTMGGMTDAVVGAYSLAGVNQTDPVPTTATNSAASGNPTISLTTQYSNSWVLDSPAIYGGSSLSSPTCTQQWNHNVSLISVTGASSNKTVATPGSVSCTWTNSHGGNGWDDAAVEIRAAAGNTVPGAPTSPTSTAVNTTALTLEWTAPGNNGGSPVTGYQIQKASTSWVTVVNDTGNVTSYTLGSLGSNSVQIYRIGAWNSIGLGPYSSNDTGYTMPTSPTNLTATAASSSQINLSWTAPGGNGTTGYKIERSTDGGSTWSTVKSDTGSTGTSYSDTGLAASTTYTYRVSTINGGGTSSPSGTASATTPAAPAGIILNGASHTSGNVTSSPYQITLSSFNASAGTNRLLVVGIEANNANVASVTFGGTALTQAISHFYNDDTEFWYLAHPNGTNNIVANMTGPTGVVMGAYALSGVNQTDPIPTTATANATSTSPTISLTTKYSNSWVLDSPSIFGGETLSSPTCTQQWDATVSGAVTGASSNKTMTSPGVVTCSWTASASDGWDDVAVEVRAAGDVGTGSWHSSTGILEPVYCDPDNNTGLNLPCPYGSTACHDGTFCWQPLVDTKNSHPHVPLFAIINPGDGPTDKSYPGYQTGIQKLTNAGVIVLGYVDTCTGCSGGTQKSVSEIESEIDNYTNFYNSDGLQGIFLDDYMEYGTPDLSCANNELHCFQEITNYIHGNFTYNIGNPGTQIDQSFYNSGAADKLDIWEESTNPSTSGLATNTYTTSGGYLKGNFTMLVYCQSSLPTRNNVTNSSNFVSLLFYTPYGTIDGTTTTCGGDGNPWEIIPTTLPTLASYLDNQSSTITIKSVDLSGLPITGYFDEVWQGGIQVPSAHSPVMDYNGTVGLYYTFKPDNSGSCTFDYWQDNTNNHMSSRTIQMTSAGQTFTAVYNGTCNH